MAAIGGYGALLNEHRENAVFDFPVVHTEPATFW